MKLNEIDYKRNPEKYQYRLLELQSENLRLSNNQLKKYWILTLVSFAFGVASTVLSQYILDKPKEELQLTYRIITLEQTVNGLEDSIQNVKVLHTILLDSLKRK